MKAATFPDEVLQLRIEIAEIEPSAFRVVQVENTRTFHLLHEIIQRSFDWKNYHLYEFHVGPARVIVPSPDFPEQAGLHPRTAADRLVSRPSWPRGARRLTPITGRCEAGPANTTTPSASILLSSTMS